MSGLPKDFDASVFVGKTLDLICFSANTINLIFEKHMSIIVMGSFIFQHNSNENANTQKVPVLSSDLMSIVNQIVNHAEAREDGTLILRFDNGQVLMILDGSRQYESYMINIGDREIIV